jgi:flavin reductase (DIM6/NTAB) family NADH-FMN oxidoreductase RutF
MSVRTFVPSEMSPREAYALLISCVAPRPIAWVSTCAPDGRVNLAPFSFFNAGGANPVSVVFSCTNFRDGRPKDTLRNVHATGEFVVNIAPYWLAEQMNQTSFEYEYGVSEFEQVGLTRAPSVYVQPPRVAESPIAMECKLFQVVSHGAGPVAAKCCASISPRRCSRPKASWTTSSPTTSGAWANRGMCAPHPKPCSAWSDQRGSRLPAS